MEDAVRGQNNIRENPGPWRLRVKWGPDTPAGEGPGRGGVFPQLHGAWIPVANKHQFSALMWGLLPGPLGCDREAGKLTCVHVTMARAELRRQCRLAGPSRTYRNVASRSASSPVAVLAHVTRFPRAASGQGWKWPRVLAAVTLGDGGRAVSLHSDKFLVLTPEAR